MELSKFEKTCVKARVGNSRLNINAVFSDETENYVCPSEPRSGDAVRITLRTWAGNASAVFLHIDGTKTNMALSKTEGFFDYYAAEYIMGDKKANYYFSLVNNGITYYYNKRGLYRAPDNSYDFSVIPDFVTPGWAVGAVMYQIFADRFYNGDDTNDVCDNEFIYLGKPARRASRWDDELSPESDICTFFGGDIKGVTEKLPYLKELGVEVIYLNPVCVSPSSHKYDIQDYDHVDPHLGSIVVDEGVPLDFEHYRNRQASMYIGRTTDIRNLDASDAVFSELVKRAHENGMKVIIDGVFNHCGSFNKWLDREGIYHGAQKYPEGAYRDQHSVYHDYFIWYDSNWPNNDCYDGWWEHKNHPKLNYEKSSELYDYMLYIGQKWVSPPYSVDGWRLDVAADLGYSPETNHRFWRDFRKAVKSANPEAVILAEHYGDPSAWLAGDQWDTLMNYDGFMEPITWFLTGMEKHSESYRPEMLNNAMAFENSMRHSFSKFSVHSYLSAMNQLSNHDHSRFMTRTNMRAGRLHTLGAAAASEGVNKAVYMEAVVFQMTWPGSPALYYGDEAGLCGWTDPDNRRTYPWGGEDAGLLEFHRDIIKVRKEYGTFKRGSTAFLYTNYGILSYGRWDSACRIAVVINNNEREKTVSVPVWKMGCPMTGSMRALIETSEADYRMNGGAHDVRDGEMVIKMPPHGAAVLIESCPEGL